MKGYREEEEKCENFSHKQLPFIDKMLHFDWASHYLLQPRGQSCLATWQQHFTACEIEFFSCRHVRCLEGERLKYSLLMKQTKMRLFLAIYTLTL
jgi:hypothetical protein